MKTKLNLAFLPTFLNIANFSDEALESFRNALKKQELALKNVKAEIDGTKEEIINFQEKHEHLTTLSIKAERLCMNRRNQIKR